MSALAEASAAPSDLVAVLRACRLTRRFRSGRGTGPLDVSVPPAAVLGILGGNGAGKSTLVRMLAGIDRPGSGAVEWWGGRDAGAARSRLGVALDTLAEDDALSGRQSAYFWCRRFVRNGGDARRRVDHALERLGLAEVANDAVATYSFGMRRRLALVEAIAHDPELLLLDEPSAGLDALGVGALREIVDERRRGGATTVIAGNDAALIAGCCDRLLLLEDGVAAPTGAASVMVERLRRLACVTIEPAEAPSAHVLAALQDQGVIGAGSSLRMVCPLDEPLAVTVAKLEACGLRVRALATRPAEVGDLSTGAAG